MAGIKKNTYIAIELEWAEKQLLEWKAYVDKNPLHELEDRVAWRTLKGGGTMPSVIASIEQQGKFIQDTIKNYLALLSEVEKMREAEEKKKTESRGDQDLSPDEMGELQ